MTVLYNEYDSFAADWLSDLVRRGLIQKGEIDARSIEEIQPTECKPTSHFFAGIGGWAYALELAGWPAERPVWTGSCPCQPFSLAGKQKGTEDQRHLWPVWRDLISICRPPTIFGEQVASPLGRDWLDGVRADLEALGYEVGAADLCAAGVGAPHMRQRLFWVAHSKDPDRRSEGSQGHNGRGQAPETGGPGSSGRVGNAKSLRRKRREDDSDKGRRECSPRQAIKASRVGNADDAGPQGRHEPGDGSGERLAGPTGMGFWRDAEGLPMRDGKTRRIEPGSFPLAHGIPARVGRLRGYGNAIVPQVAAVFVKAFMETEI